MFFLLMLFITRRCRLIAIAATPFAMLIDYAAAAAAYYAAFVTRRYYFARRFFTPMLIRCRAACALCHVADGCHVRCFDAYYARTFYHIGRHEQRHASAIRRDRCYSRQ